jgi:iron-sulfur cluster assembly protein
MCVTITPAAATFIKRMVRMGIPAGSACAGFRLTVKAGGCSGFDSSFSVEAAAQETDTIVEQEGVRVFLPESTCELLRGHTIDFGESRMDGGLKFSKPGAAHACGCGAGDPKQKSGQGTVVFMRPGGTCKQKPEAT